MYIYVSICRDHFRVQTPVQPRHTGRRRQKKKETSMERKRRCLFPNTLKSVRLTAKEQNLKISLVSCSTTILPLLKTLLDCNSMPHVYSFECSSDARRKREETKQKKTNEVYPDPTEREREKDRDTSSSSFSPQTREKKKRTGEGKKKKENVLFGWKDTRQFPTQRS